MRRLAAALALAVAATLLGVGVASAHPAFVPDVPAADGTTQLVLPHGCADDGVVPSDDAGRPTDLVVARAAAPGVRLTALAAPGWTALDTPGQRVDEAPSSGAASEGLDVDTAGDRGTRDGATALSPTAELEAGDAAWVATDGGTAGVVELPVRVTATGGRAAVPVMVHQGCGDVAVRWVGEDGLTPGTVLVLDVTAASAAHGGDDTAIPTGLLAGAAGVALLAAVVDRRRRRTRTDQHVAS